MEQQNTLEPTETKVTCTFSLAKQDAETIDTLAQERFEGNRSQALRHILREYATERTEKQ